ncbi:MAG: hypothetical protein JNG88_08445 [Phycisphaerales bacterium]|nr:hypothetical protein [Phycisphaerales bacterium]
MAVTVRAYYLDPNRNGFAGVRSAFDALDSVVISGTYEQWETLQTAISAQEADAIVVRWDALPNPELICQRIAEVASKTAIVALSAKADPDTIIAAMRAGCSQFVRVPIDAQELSGAFERIRASLSPAASIVQQRFGIIGAAGGAGCTTLACNLAAELAHLANRPAAIVDLNLELGDVACAFDCKPKYSIADVCREGIEVDRAMLENAIEKLPGNVYMLARPEKIEDVYQITAEGIEAMLGVICEVCPFAVVDLPRVMFSITSAAVNRIDRFLIVTQLSVPFVRNSLRILECLVHAGVPRDHIEVIVNRAQASHERFTLEELEKHIKQPVFAAIPNDYKRVTESRDLGHPIVYGAPNSPARLAIQQVAKKLIGGDAAASEKRQGGGLLKKLLGRK